MKGTGPTVRFLKRSAPILVLVALAASVSVPPASAQDYQTRELIERLNRLERDLGEVQRQFYKGGGLPSPDVGVPLSSSGTNTGSTQAAELSVRITQLETELRTVTGTVEKVDFEISKVRRRLDKLVADVDFRLSGIERQLAAENRLGASTSTGGAALQGEQPVSRAPAASGKPEAGTLGTLPADASGKATVAVPKGILPAGGTAQQHYDLAFSLLRQGDFAEAEQGFREFLAIHGDSDLAGNAQYWLAESFYVREQYEQAARGFLEGYQKYKGHDKALGSLLKLGMSLVKMNQKDEACASFDQLTTEFPNAAEYIKRQVTAERNKIGCK